MKLFFLLILVMSFHSHAKVNVITTTSNLADLVRQIGGDLVRVESLCRGVQDPHFLEAKPSYVFKLSKADLLVSVGADLEVGWLPLIIRGSRKPELLEGRGRHLVAANFVELLEQEHGNVSRSMGDVHPEGNPHFMLSPSNTVKVALGISKKLSELDKKNAETYAQNFMAYSSEIKSKLLGWSKKVKKNLKVVTYHKTLSYFYNEFGVVNVDVLEPKPGIPPSASHILNVIKKIREQNIQKIVIENYFDTSVAKRIKKEIPEIEILVVPVGVGGEKDVDSLFSLYELLVTRIGG